MKFFLFFLLFFLIVPAHADLFADMLNQTYVNNASEMPVYNGTPDVKLQHYKHISAWVDIVGFNGTINENGVNYIKGNPADSAIVQYDAYFDMPKGQQCYTCTLDSIKKTISVLQEGNYTVATLTVILKWHETLCDSNGACWQEYYEEKGTFQDRELSPLQYPALKQPVVNITEYNNTIQEKISVHVEAQNVSIIRISYENKTVEHVISIYSVENNTASRTNIDTWTFSGKEIGRIQDNVIIDINLSTIDYSQLNITVSNLYESITADYHAYNITRIDYTPETVLFNPILLTFVGTIAVFGYSSYSILRGLFK